MSTNALRPLTAADEIDTLAEYPAREVKGRAMEEGWVLLDDLGAPLLLPGSEDHPGPGRDRQVARLGPG